MQGPNLKKLIATKMSRDAIPAGGSVADVFKFLTDPQKIITGVTKATEWSKAAIEVIRGAAEPNPYKNAEDETIAGVILAQISERKR